MTKGGGSGGKGKGGGSGKSGRSSMSKEAASRIQSSGDRNPESRTAQSGFGQRAQSAADRTQQQQADK